jgi:hypothetical protein
VVAILTGEVVVEEGEDAIGSEIREGGIGRPAPGNLPGEVRRVVLHLGMGAGGSEPCIHGLAGDLPNALDPAVWEIKDLNNEAGEIPIHREVVLGMEVITSVVM